MKSLLSSYRCLCSHRTVLVLFRRWIDGRDSTRGRGQIRGSFRRLWSRQRRCLHVDDLFQLRWSRRHLVERRRRDRLWVWRCQDARQQSRSGIPASNIHRQSVCRRAVWKNKQSKCLGRNQTNPHWILCFQLIRTCKIFLRLGFFWGWDLRLKCP